MEIFSSMTCSLWDPGGINIVLKDHLVQFYIVPFAVGLDCISDFVIRFFNGF